MIASPVPVLSLSQHIVDRCRHVIGRLAESEDPVLYASYGEVDKCEFIKVNAPKEAWEAWSSTDDDGAGLLVKADALREQAREVLVRRAQ